MLSEMQGYYGAHNRELFYLQQAASLAQVYLSMSEGLMRAAAILPTNPILAGIAKAAIITTAGFSVANILKQEPPPEPKGFQTGGIVPRLSGSSATGDRQLAYLEAGELVTPRASAEDEVDRRARQKGYNRVDQDMDEDQAQDYQEMRVSFEETISDYVFTQQRRNRALGIGVT